MNILNWIYDMFWQLNNGGSMTIKNIEKTILQLSPSKRIHIVENILASLNHPDRKIEKMWITESEKRYSAFKAGKIKPISLQNIKKRLA